MVDSPIIDDPAHTFVIAEAGSNWKIGSYEENLKMSEKLIEIAAQSGADAIKFQTFRSQTLYAPDAGQVEYLKNSGEGKKINDLVNDLEMPYEILQNLAECCEENNIIFMSTSFSVEDAKEVDKFSPIHKIASYEINHIKLLEYLSHINKPILLSTGASTFEEIDFAVNLLKKNKHNKIGLLQCTSKYPAPLNSLNLFVIPQMRKRYNVPIGFSDHSVDPLIGPLLAIGLGATIIEKHFTLDKKLPGPDHFFALEPVELKTMISSIRNADSAKGSGEKTILDVERELQKFATRSVQASKNISKGDIFQENNIDLLRPGKRKRGADARFFGDIIGKKAVKDIPIGDGVSFEDCKD
jgi:N-acetylneuraminate synthase